MLTVGNGDAVQLAYIRERYNTLLRRKEEFEEQIRAGRNQTSNIGLLLETQAELIKLDDTRTAFVNRKQLEVPVGNIKIVTRKPKLDYYNDLLLNKKTAPGKFCSKSSKHFEVKQVVAKGKYKQKNLITI